MTETAERDADDSGDLGAAAEILYEEGNTRAAALLIDARFTIEYRDMGFSLSDDSDPTVLVDGVLTVPRYQVERYSEAVTAAIEGALSEVLSIGGIAMLAFHVRAEVPAAQANWRETLAARLEPAAMNQATVGPPPKDSIREDRCVFRSDAELRVYRSLKRARSALRADDALSIAPNPALVLPTTTFEPDFLVAWRGRIGVIEVDGLTHGTRRAADTTKDRLYKDCGVREVERILVDETDDADALDLLVQRFLKRLVR